MPELPEVETIVSSLRPLIIGRKIITVEVKYHPIVGYPEVERFVAELQNNEIQAVKRRGKYIVIELSNDRLLITHLRMSGKLIYVNSKEELDKHTHLIITFDNGYQLRFIETRKFGRMFLISENDLSKAGGFATLGPEPLEMSEEEFLQRMEGKKTKIKPLILRQDFIAGIGNIYADEALFLSKIHPKRPADSLSLEEKKRLFHSIQKVLLQGIKNRGTTRKDYVDSSGLKGNNQYYLNVYGLEGEECKVCGSIIKRIEVGGRSSHFCPECQPLDP